MERNERSTSGLLRLPFSMTTPGEITSDSEEIRCERRPTIIFTPFILTDGFRGVFSSTVGLSRL